MNQPTRPAETVSSERLLGALAEIKAALEATPEYENFECNYGPTLGTCTNEACLPCRVYRALKKVAPNATELNDNGTQRHGHNADRVTTADMLRASEVCAHAAKDPLNRGEIASILESASRILANTSLRPALANNLYDTRSRIEPTV